MKHLSLIILFLVVSAGILYAVATTKDGFQFPEIFVTIMNLIVVPLFCQVIKQITTVREIRAIIAAVLSFITAIVAILITGHGSFQNLLALLILSYTVAQLAYNLFWSRLLQNGSAKV